MTRGEANHGKEWKTDEEAVLKTITRADYIFAGHSHADHIADIPFIAKKFGSKVIGSRTTAQASRGHSFARVAPGLGAPTFSSLLKHASNKKGFAVHGFRL